MRAAGTDVVRAVRARPCGCCRLVAVVLACGLGLSWSSVLACLGRRPLPVALVVGLCRAVVVSPCLGSLPHARKAERYASGAAESGSGADAGSRRLHAIVRLCIEKGSRHDGFLLCIGGLALNLAQTLFKQ